MFHKIRIREVFLIKLYFKATTDIYFNLHPTQEEVISLLIVKPLLTDTKLFRWIDMLFRWDYYH